MRAKEFIFEAKPENLGQVLVDKLFAKYSQTDIKDATITPKFTDGVGVANYIYQVVGPKYLIWVAKQYANDNYFFLHQLEAVKSILSDFVAVSNGRVPIEKDISKYKSIGELRDTIDKAKKTVGSSGSSYFTKAVSRINEMVKSGQAEWLYQSNQYVIYQPKTFEASHMMSALISTTICTILNEDHFEQYNYSGILMYIIPNSEPETLYNCYISRSVADCPSEFANAQNDRKFGFDWQVSHFPALMPLVLKNIEISTDLKIQLLQFDTDEEKKQHCVELFDVGFELSDVPEQLRDYDVCLAAVKEDKYAIRDVPSELQPRIRADLGL
jgi:hypothetical protein